MNNYKIGINSVLEDLVTIGIGTVIWDNCYIRQNTEIGSEVMIGRNVFVDHDVKIGNFVRVQNNSLIYYPSIIESEVFIGPSVIITNDKYPRVNKIKSSDPNFNLWQVSKVHIKQGASLGAGVICVGPSIIGEWSMIAAGSVLIGNATPFGLYMGSPAKRVGWVGHAGRTLVNSDKSGIFYCPISKKEYKEVQLDRLEEV